jgi:hypothetical protein
MTTPTVTQTRPNANHVGERVELARYTLPDGEQRVLYGERVNGMVSFLPEQPVVVDTPPAHGEDSNRRHRERLEDEGRPDAARQKRPNGDDEPTGPGDETSRRGPTGERVELARYTVSAGERVLYGQRVLGVVRVTDVPLAPRGRAYVVERGLEEEGANANAALQALIADYVRQASVLDEVPMAASRL